MGSTDNRIKQGNRHRVLSGTDRILANGILYALILVGIFWILEIPIHLGLMLMAKQYIGVFLGLSLAGIYVTVPCRKGEAANAVPWFDWIMAWLSIVIGFYVAIFYPSIQYVLNLETPVRIVLGAIAIVLVIEALRRTVGWIMVVIAGFFLLYAPLAGHFPGMLEGKATPVGALLNYIYLDSNAVLGVPITVAATIILSFLLLGHALSVTGASQFFMDLAIALMGRYRGGPAKMAVVASSLFGTISGAAVANVVTTGIITIPLMKKAGFRAETAGAIEATASTGGQLMPPVMGAAAFLIAELLAIPYRDVVVASLIPAVLFYFTVFVQIDLEAAKFNIKGIPVSELPTHRPGAEKWLGGSDPTCHTDFCAVHSELPARQGRHDRIGSAAAVGPFQEAGAPQCRHASPNRVEHRLRHAGDGGHLRRGRHRYRSAQCQRPWLWSLPGAGQHRGAKTCFCCLFSQRSYA